MWYYRTNLWYYRKALQYYPSMVRYYRSCGRSQVRPCCTRQRAVEPLEQYYRAPLRYYRKHYKKIHFRDDTCLSQ